MKTTADLPGWKYEAVHEPPKARFIRFTHLQTGAVYEIVANGRQQVLNDLARAVQKSSASER